MLNIVFVAGYGNSTKGHWQHSWSQKVSDSYNSYWVEQADWDNPNCADWIDALNVLVQSLQGPILLVSHSLGGSTIVEWSHKYAATGAANVLGAFMVAVPDVNSEHFPKAITGYGDAPSVKLPFPSLMLASTNDPYATLASTQKMVKQWGCRLTVMGELKHINAESNLGLWPEGYQLLTDFIKLVTATK
ncbi:RBBP9/YdeN family alpha/beta hydrolase [Shewanella youngdeokensis]|uniref:Alpha/beta hydrolase n=1 Tax=Shewanella youngdeokensis TaxID=2999068 RepID=A0ABZ0JX85_9GAMM|nr:alpha/beta hydrolase [Shewanella sp. DAU334]